MQKYKNCEEEHEKIYLHLGVAEEFFSKTWRANLWKKKKSKMNFMPIKVSTL